eukprot:c15761_g1_i2 orf=130-417(-)
MSSTNERYRHLTGTRRKSLIKMGGVVIWISFPALLISIAICICCYFLGKNHGRRESLPSYGAPAPPPGAYPPAPPPGAYPPSRPHGKGTFGTEAA